MDLINFILNGGAIVMVFASGVYLLCAGIVLAFKPERLVSRVNDRLSTYESASAALYDSRVGYALYGSTAVYCFACWGEAWVAGLAPTIIIFMDLFATFTYFNKKKREV